MAAIDRPAPWLRPFIVKTIPTDPGVTDTTWIS